LFICKIEKKKFWKKKKMKAKFKVLENEQKKILPFHKCFKCQLIVTEVYECPNRCGIACKEHFPNNKKCEICQEDLLFNENLSQKIKQRYQISCINCLKEMMLENFENHHKTECKFNCPQNCGNKFFEYQLEEHLKNDCINTIISCVICKETNKRGLIKLHEDDCPYAQKHFDLMNPLIKENQQLHSELQTIKEKIELIEKDNQNLKEKIGLIEKDNVSLKERLELLEKGNKSSLIINKFNQNASINNLNEKWIVKKTLNSGWNCNVCTNALNPSNKVYICKIVRNFLFPLLQQS
jgi:hypothetical protein